MSLPYCSVSYLHLFSGLACNKCREIFTQLFRIRGRDGKPMDEVGSSCICSRAEICQGDSRIDRDKMLIALG